eukprot:GHVU01086406.1.p1 GENE.GHVU01086406.1~~GHVU01086406.1.p1  ORF type:complete len:628 (+),score=49.56 GHVU01086406.1:259-1884(+)
MTTPSKDAAHPIIVKFEGVHSAMLREQTRGVPTAARSALTLLKGLAPKRASLALMASGYQVTPQQVKERNRHCGKMAHADNRIDTVMSLYNEARKKLVTSREAYDLLKRHEIVTLVNGVKEGVRGVAFSSPCMLENTIRATEGTMPLMLCADGACRIHDAGYTVMTLGAVNVKYADSDASVTHGSRPIAYMFAESESEEAYTVMIKGIEDTLKLIDSDLRFEPVVVIADAAMGLYNAVKACLPMAKLINCWVHVLTNLNENVGKLVDKAYYEIVRLVIIMLHLCRSKLQFMSMGAYFVEAMKADGETAIAEWFYTYHIQPPFNEWFMTASPVAGAVPNNNLSEAYNAVVKRSKVPHIRGDATTLWNETFPALLVADGIDRGSDRPINGTVPLKTVKEVEVAAKMQECKRYFISNSCLYYNASVCRSFPLNEERMRVYESSLHGTVKTLVPSRGLKADETLQPLEFVQQQNLSLHKVQRKAGSISSSAEWVCDCEFYQRGRTCSGVTLNDALLGNYNLRETLAPIPRQQSGRKKSTNRCNGR